MDKIIHFDDSTPLWQLTVGQLKELFANSSIMPGGPPAPKRMAYGLSGICDLFHCGESKALKLKNTIIKEAVFQDGRKIVVDVDLALQLFEQRTTNQKKR